MAIDPFADILSRLQAALVAESAQVLRTPVIVAARDTDTLRAFWASRPQLGVRFEPFEGRADADVQIGPAGAALWMDPVPDGYRAVFGRFLRAHWGVTASLAGSGFDVDHVYNRARAKAYGYARVRMFLVRDVVNRDHGRSYEKQIGAAERRRHVKIMKLLDGMSELKTLGIPPVKDGVLTQAHFAAAALAAQHYGIPQAEALATLHAMFGRAHPDTA
jgi:hypothetical protein